MANLGNDLYSELRTLWRKAQHHAKHDDATDLYPLAIEWERLVSERAKEKGEPEPSKMGGYSMPKELAEAISKALEKSADESAWTASFDLGNQEQDEKWEQDVKSRTEESERRKNAKKEETKVFSKSSTEPEFGTSMSRLLESRKPTSQERVASVKIGQLLDKAKYRERDLTTTTSVLPQGRLRSRAIIQGQALKSKGIHTPVEAWKHKTRKQTDEPTLSIGVMVDISGSMGMAMTPMATTAWVLGEAGRRVQAKTAMVYFGSGVFPTLRVGQRQDEVKVYSAPDGTEKFNEAFMALDGHLTLLDGVGAKLLVVVSDGHFTSEQSRHTRNWVVECDKKGVAVLWITYDSKTGNLEQYLENTSGECVSLAGSTPEQSAILIGKSAATALGAIGKKNV
jgi:hypothetical protein